MSRRLVTVRTLVALAALAPLAQITLAGTARAEEVGQSVRSVLQDDRYRFCHEDDYPLTPAEHAWCPLVGEVSGACPSLAKACKLPPVEISGSAWRFGRRQRGTGEGPAVEREPQADARQRPEPESSFHLPDMTIFARVLFFGLIAVGLAFVVRAILRNLQRDRAPADEKDEAAPTDAPGAAEPVERGPVETDVERLLSRARAAAARGDYARAIDDAYAALLRRLDGDGLIEIHPSRTNGDYVRRLGERPDLKGPVRSIARDVEGVQFGATPPSEPVFRSVLERILPLVGRALAVALLFFGLSAAASCTPHGHNGGDEGHADTSPSGAQAIIEVLGKHGLKVHRRAEAISKLERPLALVVLPDVVLDDAAWKHLLEWVRVKGGHLVVAGARSLPPELELRIVKDDAQGTAITVAPENRWVGLPALSLPPGRRIVDASDSSDADGGAAASIVQATLDGAVLFRGGSVVATERPLGEGHVLLVADERLFTNIALTVDDDASFLLSALFHASIPPDREVEIADRWTGAGAQTPMASVQNAHLTPGHPPALRPRRAALPLEGPGVFPPARSARRGAARLRRPRARPRRGVQPGARVAPRDWALRGVGARPPARAGPPLGPAGAHPARRGHRGAHRAAPRGRS